MEDSKTERKRRKKVCPKCGQNLWLKDFHRTKDGSPSSYCKICSTIQRREWYQAKRKKPDGVFLHPTYGRLMEHSGQTLRIHWNENMLSILRRYFPNTRTEEVAEMLGVSPRTTVRKARELGLEKDLVFLHAVWDENRMMARVEGKRKQAGWFQKGRVPWNKGLKLKE